MEYDDQGQLIRQAVYNLQGNPVDLSDGYSFFTKEYSEDHSVKTSYYNSKGDPVTIKAGYQVLIQYYDENNVQIGEGYFNTSEEPVMLQAGYCYVEIIKNEDGTTTRNYLDTDDKVVKSETK